MGSFEMDVVEMDVGPAPKWLGAPLNPPGGTHPILRPTLEVWEFAVRTSTSIQISKNIATIESHWRVAWHLHAPGQLAAGLMAICRFVIGLESYWPLPIGLRWLQGKSDKDRMYHQA